MMGVVADAAAIKAARSSATPAAAFRADSPRNFRPVAVVVLQRIYLTLAAAWYTGNCRRVSVGLPFTVPRTPSMSVSHTRGTR